MFYGRRRPFRLADCAGPGMWFLTIAPVRGSVATIVRSFKAAVTREARSMLGAPVVLWQKGCHALRIVDRDGLDRARQYIRLNPKRWTERNAPPRERSKATRFVTLPWRAQRGASRVRRASTTPTAWCSLARHRRA